MDESPSWCSFWDVLELGSLFRVVCRCTTSLNSCRLLDPLATSFRRRWILRISQIFVHGCRNLISNSTTFRPAYLLDLLSRGWQRNYIPARSLFVLFTRSEHHIPKVNRSRVSLKLPKLVPVHNLKIASSASEAGIPHTALRNRLLW